MVLFQARTRRRCGIPAEWYSRDYFLSDLCEGYREYLAGASVSYVKRKPLAYVDPRPGGKSRYTESLAGSRLILAAARVVSREPLVRIFANDLWVLARAGPRAE
jgi:hypothetical protein